MTSEVPHDWHNALLSGGRRPAPKPQRMDPVPVTARREFAAMVQVDLIKPPCGECLHKPVCLRAGALEALVPTVRVDLPALSGLVIAGPVAIACDQVLLRDVIPLIGPKKAGHRPLSQVAQPVTARPKLLGAGPGIPATERLVTLTVPEPAETAAEPASEAEAPEVAPEGAAELRKSSYSPEGLRRNRRGQIRRRHPDWTDAQVEARILELEAQGSLRAGTEG